MNNKDIKQLENDLWAAADNLRANSDLKSSEYSTPVLGLIFLKFADNSYRRHEQAIRDEYEKLKGTRREKPLSEIAIEQCGFYLPDHARYDYLLRLPEAQDIAKALKAAMKTIEDYKPELEGVLPQDEYFRLTRTDSTIPNQLLKSFSNIPRDASGDMFGISMSISWASSRWPRGPDFQGLLSVNDRAARRHPAYSPCLALPSGGRVGGAASVTLFYDEAAYTVGRDGNPSAGLRRYAPNPAYICRFTYSVNERADVDKRLSARPARDIPVLAEELKR